MRTEDGVAYTLLCIYLASAFIWLLPGILCFLLQNKLFNPSNLYCKASIVHAMQSEAHSMEYISDTKADSKQLQQAMGIWMAPGREATLHLLQQTSFM